MIAAPLMALALTVSAYTRATPDPREHRTALRNCRELLITKLQAFRIRSFLAAARLQNRCAMELLQTAAQHWAIDFVKQALSDVDDACRSDTEEIAVVGEVVDRA